LLDERVTVRGSQKSIVRCLQTILCGSLPVDRGQGAVLGRLLTVLARAFALFAGAHHVPSRPSGSLS
jgi:hypothetical protein